MQLKNGRFFAELNLHHPPCREQIRNAGFYAMATLAHTLAMGVKLIGESSAKRHERQSQRVKQGATAEPAHVRPRRGMRLWRIMRRLFALPARVVSHARRLKVSFLGVSPEVQAQFQHWYEAIARC
ncbi:MAG: hypothetical protein ACOCVL_02735 [Candidatus Sumerlaeota bacterium]